MVTEVLDVIFCRVIVYSGFVGAGRVDRGGGRDPNTVKDRQGKFRNVKVCIVARMYFRVFVQRGIPVFAIWVLLGGGDKYIRVNIGGSYPIWFKYWYFGAVLRAIVHIPCNYCDLATWVCSAVFVVLCKSPRNSFNPV